MSGMPRSSELENSSRLFHESRNSVQIVHSPVEKNGTVNYNPAKTSTDIQRDPACSIVTSADTLSDIFEVTISSKDTRKSSEMILLGI